MMHRRIELLSSLEVPASNKGMSKKGSLRYFSWSKTSHFSTVFDV